jgi:hypothetical protein
MKRFQIERPQVPMCRIPAHLQGQTSFSGVAE